MSKWKITGDCVYEEADNNSVAPECNVICYMHPDATAKDRQLVMNAPEMRKCLEESYSFLKRFFYVVVETGNSLLLDYFREYDGLPTRIKEVLEGDNK